MLRKTLRLSGHQLRRALVLGVCFAGGWAAYAHFHPKPLLQDRWAALVKDPKTRAAPGQSGRRTDGAGSLAGGNPADGGRGGGGTEKVTFSLEDLMAMRNPIAQGLALAEAVKTADADTCRRWLETLDKHPHEAFRLAGVAVVTERWTAIDPAGALAAAGEHEGRKATVFRRWAHYDPAAALAAGGKPYHDAIQQGLMETDPEHAASRWREIAPDSPFPIATLEFALKGQVKKDPERAMRQVPDGGDPETSGIRADLFGSWMDRDADAALKFAEGHADAGTRRQLFGEFARRFPDRMEPMLAGLEGGEKNDLVLNIAKGQAARDPLAAAHWLRSQTAPEEFAGILTEFTRDQRGLSPEKLGGILALCPDDAAQDRLLREISEGPMHETVGAWLKAQPAGSLSPARQAVAFNVLTPEEAARVMPGETAIPRSESDRILQGQFSRWYPAGPMAMGAELSLLPDSMQSAAAGIFLNQERYFVQKEDAITVEKALPPDRVAEIFSNLPPSAQGQTALSFAWRQQSNPAAAAHTLAASRAAPDDPAAAAVYETVARNWAGTDAPAASGWVQTLPPGPARDAAALALIQSQAATDPAGAAAWARTLQDPVTVMRAQLILNPDHTSESGSGSSP